MCGFIALLITHPTSEQLNWSFIGLHSLDGSGPFGGGEDGFALKVSMLEIRITHVVSDIFIVLVGAGGIL
jgi:hypothetical protein